MTSVKQEHPRVERVDDIPVIYGALERMSIQPLIDGAVHAHTNWHGLSPGWVITLWLVHILSEQNHLMEPVEQWVGRHLTILSELSGQPVRVLDFSDDRLAMCLRDLSKKGTWVKIEEAAEMSSHTRSLSAFSFETMTKPDSSSRLST